MHRTVGDTSDVAEKGHRATHRIGWVGAGKMGYPMVRNLLGRAVPVAVTEPAADQVAGLVAEGATHAEALADQAGSQIVFSTLPHDSALLDVVLGAEGAPGLAGILAKGSIFVEMSTVSPQCSAIVAEHLKESGISYLRAPLSGSTELAEQATLTVLASGDRADWDTVLPYIEMMSARQFLVGADEEARYMKLVLNTLVGASSALLAEALSLGTSGGLSRTDMMEVIGASAVASPLFAYKAQAVIDEDYAPAFTVDQMIKDFSLISDAGRHNGVPLLTTSLILELYRAASNSGLDNKDFFSLVKWQQELSNR